MKAFTQFASIIFPRNFILLLVLEKDLRLKKKINDSGSLREKTVETLTAAADFVKF